MKKLLIAIAIAFIATGCGHLKSALTTEKVTQQAVPKEVVSNVNGSLFTNIVQTIEYRTNYVAKPVIETAVEATNAIPAWGGLISTILSGALGAYIASLNKKRGKAIATALITATEAGREVLRGMPDGERIDKMFIDAVIAQQLQKGQADPITQLVKDLTK